MNVVIIEFECHTSWLNQKKNHKNFLYFTTKLWFSKRKFKRKRNTKELKINCFLNDYDLIDLI